MTFFRVKKIKGKEYAYLVENEWKRKGSRQKVKGYLGKVFRLESKNQIMFSEFAKIKNMDNYIRENTAQKIIGDLVRWELLKFDITDEFSVNFENKTIKKGKNNSVIAINEGFLCNLTIKNLLEFKPETNEEDDGFRFARAFVEAGIKVPQEIFIGLFAKLYKIENKKIE